MKIPKYYVYRTSTPYTRIYSGSLSRCRAWVRNTGRSEAVRRGQLILSSIPPHKIQRSIERRNGVPAKSLFGLPEVLHLEQGGKVYVVATAILKHYLNTGKVL